MDMKKIGAIGVVSVLAILLVFALVANTNKYNQEEVAVAVMNAVSPLQDDIDALDIKVSELIDANVLLTENVDSLNADITDKETKIAELEAQIVDLTPVETVEEEVVEAEIIDDLELGDFVEFNLDDNDLSKLIDSEIDFNGDDYDVHEEFIGHDSLVIAINGYGYDEEFSGEPYLITTDEGALEYRYVFDDVINMTEIGNDEPLEIVFLGEPMKIVYADANELKVEFGVELLLNLNEPYEYENINLVLFGVGDDEAYITYNGVTKSIDEGQTKDVGGLDVKVLEVFASDIGNVAFAKVVIGSEVEKTLESNDEYLKDEKFKFVIESTGDDLEALVILYDVKSDELDDDYLPLALGESILFPNDFLTLEFAELTTVDYVDFEVYFDEFDAEDDLVSDENGVVLEAGKAIIEIDNEEFEEIYFMDSGIYYLNEDNDFTLATDSEAIIVNDDYESKIWFNGNKLVFEDTSGKLKLDVDFDNLRLGLLEEDAETNDVTYLGNGFGTMDYDLLLGSGVIVLDVENNAENDEVKFKVPSEVVEAVVTVY